MTSNLAVPREHWFLHFSKNVSGHHCHLPCNPLSPAGGVALPGPQVADHGGALHAKPGFQQEEAPFLTTLKCLS